MAKTAVLLGRLSPDTAKWEEEFHTPLFREAIIRTIKENIGKGWKVKNETPEPHWHKDGKVYTDRQLGLMPCWVWWVEPA